MSVRSRTTTRAAAGLIAIEIVLSAMAVILPSCSKASTPSAPSTQPNLPTPARTTTSASPQGVKTIAVDVPQVGKDAFRRDLEVRLAEALVKRLELDTPYKVTKKAIADTLLESTIESVGQRALSLDPETGLPRDVEVTIVVAFTWSNLREDRVLVHRESIRVSGTCTYSATGSSQPANSAPAASEDIFPAGTEIIANLAQKIVTEMEAK